MQDDYVCGTDYEYCLDPTGKYIVDGEIVVGSTPGYVVDDDSTENGEPPSDPYGKDTLYGTWYYDNGNKHAFGDSTAGGSLTEYINNTVTSKAVTEIPNDGLMSSYLLYKIGYDEGGKNYGMCMSVLNKCQDYTYKNKVYQPDNNVVKEYLQRTLTKIKVAQDEVIAKYAENCISDVSSCLASNNYENAKNIAINACRAQIRTCMSVNGDSTAKPSPTQMVNWVKTMLGQLNSPDKVAACYDTGGAYKRGSDGNPTCECSSPRTKLNDATGQCECPDGQEWDATSSTCKDKES